MTALNWKQKRQEHAESGALDKAKDGSTFEPIPVGTWVDMRIEVVDERPTQRDGLRIFMKFKVEGPEEFKGRVLIDGFNVICPGSEDAERIALEKMTAISLASGLEDCVEELTDLIGRTVRANVYEHDEFNGRINEQLRDWSKSEVEGQPLEYADDEIPF